MNEPSNGNIALLIIFIIVFSKITNLVFAATFFTVLVVAIYLAIRGIAIIYDHFFNRNY